MTRGDDIPALLTVGHGDRDAIARRSLLQDAGTTTPVDTRTRPCSRRLPQFDEPALCTTCTACGRYYLTRVETCHGEGGHWAREDSDA